MLLVRKLSTLCNVRGTKPASCNLPCVRATPGGTGPNASSVLLLCLWLALLWAAQLVRCLPQTAHPRAAVITPLCLPKMKPNHAHLLLPTYAWSLSTLLLQPLLASEHTHLSGRSGVIWQSSNHLTMSSFWALKGRPRSRRTLLGPAS